VREVGPQLGIENPVEVRPKRGEGLKTSPFGPELEVTR
jgi:hypothetical protein